LLEKNIVEKKDINNKFENFGLVFYGKTGHEREKMG